MALTNKAILDSKPESKARKLFDGGGLYIEVAPSGAKLWRLKYRFGGREKRLALGTYPDTSLAVAREKREIARSMLASGVDPGESRKAEKVAELELRHTRQTPALRGPRLPERLGLAAASQRPLEPLGIDELEERTYRTLLIHGMASAKEIADALRMTLRRAQHLLDGIESKGLASHSPERPRRYIAVPPELAIEALIGQRQVVLERARSTIPEFKRQAANSTRARSPEEAVEVITNQAALGRILAQLRQTVQEEVIGFQRAPWLYRKDIDRPEIRPGVRLRSISDAGYIALPGALAKLRSEIERGEEARIFPVLPIKMFVVDRRVALIPLSVEDQGGPTLLVRAPALLDALFELFEMTWARATPIAFSRTGAMAPGKPEVPMSDAAAQMIPLLAAGLNDKAIVHESGISIATLNRRIVELMRRFDTRTRFQLGWRAALHTFPERLSSPARRKR